MIHFMNRLILLSLGFAAFAVVIGASRLGAQETSGATSAKQAVSLGDPQRGYELLVKQPFLPPDFDEAIFDQVWQVWPRPLRERAAAATPAQRRQMAFDRYGLTPRNETAVDQLPGPPLQYVVTPSVSGQGHDWTMNCFSCHGGTVYGTPYPGAPNNRFALQTMTEELRATKLKLAKPLSRMDFGSLVIPLGSTHGTTNAVVFGIGLMSRRDTELNLIDEIPNTLIHHDMDAPPWWHFYKRPSIYIDGFAARGHRGLMQFTLVPENGPQFYREHENDFKHIHAYLMSLRPPRYDGPINQDLATQGHKLFDSTCASCHGTYGAQSNYPNVRVPLREIGTDPIRLTALPVQGRQKYADSWFAIDADGSRQQTTVDPDGYVAPPLDGVWASAPYFHNGSVPTLWHVLHPESRPSMWRPISQAFDAEKVGLTVETVTRIPLTQTDIASRRQYFDTTKLGKSNAGHHYPNELTKDEKIAVLEYLKTL